MIAFLQKQWFLIALLFLLVAGFNTASELLFLTKIGWLKWAVVASTLFLMAWPLRFGVLKRSITRPMGPLYASFLNLVLVPLLAWPFSVYLGGTLGAGLIVAAAVPSTLASGAVWTRRAGGDDSVALVVTIITNSLCFLVTLTWVYYLAGETVEREVFVGTVYKLLWFVVLPMALGQLARIHPKSATWATNQKTMLGVLAQIGLLFVVLLGAINMGLRQASPDAESTEVVKFVTLIVIVLGIHLLTLWLGMIGGKLLGKRRPEQIAIGISGSQKTLMVGLSTALSMGLSILPLIVYHTGQLIVDTVIADYLRTTGQGSYEVETFGDKEEERG